MILGLKRQVISRFLQSAKLKLTEKKNIQEIQRCLEDGISFCRVTDKTPRKGNVMMFNFKHDTSQYNFFESVTSNNEVCNGSDHIFFHEAPNVLAKAVLTDIHEQADNYGKIQAMECNKYYNGDSLVDIPKNENVVVKLCNQEITESFHAAHLRRIMYGRFITNITKLFNKNVTSINYLHDWLDMMVILSDKRDLSRTKEERIDLSDAFKKIPKYNWAKRRSYLLTFMKSVEKGDQKALEFWKKCRNVCVGDHEKMYQRLGIKFDVTSAQSHYTEQADQVISMAEEKNLLLVIPETGQQYIDVTEAWKQKPKSIFLNNQLTYGPRDLAAILDYFNKYSPDRLIYVSDSYMDFALRKYLEKVEEALGPDQPGRIEFASIKSRLFLCSWTPLTNCYEILDELMTSKAAIMLKHKLGEDCESLSDVTDKLNISQFAMRNFKRMRCEDFLSIFEREKMQKAFIHRDGVTLQYTHARLCRLITLYSDSYSFKSVNFNLLSEDCAILLVQHLARYHEVLIQCYMELEAHHLGNYLITLLKLEHIAYEELLVFNQPKEIRDARLTLFKCTRQVLANGMNILGIQPLGKI